MKERKKLKWLKNHVKHVGTFPDMSPKTQKLLMNLAEKSNDLDVVITTLQAIVDVGCAKYNKEMRKIYPESDRRVDPKSFADRALMRMCPGNPYIVQSMPYPSKELWHAATMACPEIVNGMTLTSSKQLASFPDIDALANKMLQLDKAGYKKKEFMKKHPIQAIFFRWQMQKRPLIDYVNTR